jgi:hypothetical protein
VEGLVQLPYSHQYFFNNNSDDGSFYAHTLLAFLGKLLHASNLPFADVCLLMAACGILAGVLS